MHPKDPDGVVNSVDSEQTVPSVGVWSGSALFAEIPSIQNLYGNQSITK